MEWSSEIFIEKLTDKGRETSNTPANVLLQLEGSPTDKCTMTKEGY